MGTRNDSERSVSDTVSEERCFHSSTNEGDEPGLSERWIVKTERDVCADGLDMKCK